MNDPRPGRSLPALFLASALLAQTPAGPPAPQWQDFAPPGGGFSLRMPGTPDRPAASPEGLHQFEVKAGPRDYTVSYADLLPEMKGMAPEQVLQSLRDKFVKSTPGARLIGSRTFRLGSHPGISWVVEASADGRAYRMKMAAVVAADRLFHYGLIAPADLYDEAAADRFLDTFRLLDAP